MNDITMWYHESKEEIKFKYLIQWNTNNNILFEDNIRPREDLTTGKIIIIINKN